MNTLEAALTYAQCGLSVIPVKADGSKSPAIDSWKQYEEQPADSLDILEWFEDTTATKGVAIIGGAVSGGLEIIDIESNEIAAQWRKLVAQAEGGKTLLNKLVVVKTPKGYHCYYRCSQPGRNTDLAKRPATADELKANPKRKSYKLIETRAEGGYVIAPGSPPEVHPLGVAYEFSRRDFSHLQLITNEERELLLECARSLNQLFKSEYPEPTAGSEGERPGDLFNARATWAEVLEPHGWKKGNAGRWFRPGGNRESAFEMPETNNLWVFSTSTALPFEKALSKYAAYAVLNCGGDFSKAAGELAQKGYCVPKQEPQKARRAEIVTTPQIGARKQFTVASTKELMAKEFEPLQWAIDDLLPEGLTILAGAPKLGKSWLSLDIALAVSRGEKVMGGYATNKGEVLYLALEDSERRLQSRLNVIAEEERTADNAELFCSPDFPNMLSGGLECLEEFLKAHPNCRLVIIDTLAKFLPPNERGSNAYQADYKVMGVLQKLAMTFGVAILGVHHVRKQKSSDAFDDVSGSAGITGAADSSWLLKRGRNETTGTLMVTGRDIEEAEFSAEFDKDNCRWKLLGDATQDKRRRHLQILHDAFQNEQFSRSSAETFLRLSTAQAKRVLASMYQSGYLTRESTGTVGKKTHHYRLTEKIGQLIIKKQRDIFGAIRQ